MSANADHVMQLEHISVEFRLPKRTLRAVDDVSLNVRRGEILGIVGESGSVSSFRSLPAPRSRRG